MQIGAPHSASGGWGQGVKQQQEQVISSSRHREERVGEGAGGECRKTGQSGQMGPSIYIRMNERMDQTAFSQNALESYLLHVKSCNTLPTFLISREICFTKPTTELTAHHPFYLSYLHLKNTLKLKIMRSAAASVFPLTQLAPLISVLLSVS